MTGNVIRLSSTRTATLGLLCAPGLVGGSLSDGRAAGRLFNGEQLSVIPISMHPQFGVTCRARRTAGVAFVQAITCHIHAPFKFTQRPINPR